MGNKSSTEAGEQQQQQQQVQPSSNPSTSTLPPAPSSVSGVPGHGFASTVPSSLSSVSTVHSDSSTLSTVTPTVLSSSMAPVLHPLPSTAPPSSSSASSLSTLSSSSPSSSLSTSSSSSSAFPSTDRFYGLENFGNTCYANSVLQALYACQPFRLQSRMSGGKKNRGVLSPLSLVKKVRRVNPQFDSYYHQDAQEFLIFLLNDISDTIKAERKAEKEARDRAAKDKQQAVIASVMQQQQHAHIKKTKTLPSITHSLPLTPAAIASPATQGRKPSLSSASSLFPTQPYTAASIQAILTTSSAASTGQSSSADASAGCIDMVMPGFSTAFPSSTATSVSLSLPSSSLVLPNLSSLSAATAMGALLNNVHTTATTSSARKASEDASASVSSPAEAGPITWVQQLFEGTLTNGTECVRCGAVRYRNEQFFDLSLEIEENSSITQCLRSFSGREMLSSDDKYLCEGCGCRQEAKKTLAIKHIPEILVLHIKRFKFSEHLNTLAKLSYRVVFPMDLKLGTAASLSEIPTYSTHNNNNNNSTSYCATDTRYNLIAVVVHIGSGVRYGHYISMVRHTSGGWYLYDDETISVISEEDIKSTFGSPAAAAHQDGYLLFYAQDKHIKDQPIHLKHTPQHTIQQCQSRGKVCPQLPTKKRWMGGESNDSDRIVVRTCDPTRIERCGNASGKRLNQTSIRQQSKLGAF